MGARSVLVLAAALLATAWLPQAQALSVTSGLVARYDFTGNLTDSAGGNNLTAGGGLSLVADRSGVAAAALGGFNGANAASGSVPGIPAGAKSISFWFDSTGIPSGGEYHFLGDLSISSQFGSRLMLDATLHPMWWGGKGTGGQFNFTTTATTAITQNKWQWLGFTWDGTTAANAVKIYLNGSLIGQGTALATETGAGSESLFIGDDEGNRGHVGAIDEVTFWNRALTPTEVTTVYSESLPVPEPGVLAVLGLGALGRCLSRRRDDARNRA